MEIQDVINGIKQSRYYAENDLQGKREHEEGYVQVDYSKDNGNDFVSLCCSIIDNGFDRANGFQIDFHTRRLGDDVLVLLHKVDWPLRVFKHRPEMFQRVRYTQEQLSRIQYAKVDESNK